MNLRTYKANNIGVPLTVTRLKCSVVPVVRHAVGVTIKLKGIPVLAEDGRGRAVKVEAPVVVLDGVYPKVLL